MKDITIKLSLIFRKEFKKLAKKYRSLPFDLEKINRIDSRESYTRHGFR